MTRCTSSCKRGRLEYGGWERRARKRWRVFPHAVCRRGTFATSGVKLINLDEGVKVATVSKVRKNPSDENGSEASDENGYSEENIATDTQEDAVDIQDKSIDRLLDAAEKDQQQ